MTGVRMDALFSALSESVKNPISNPRYLALSAYICGSLRDSHADPKDVSRVYSYIEDAFVAVSKGYEAAALKSATDALFAVGEMVERWNSKQG